MFTKTIIATATAIVLLAGPAAAQNTKVDAAGGKGLVVVTLNDTIEDTTIELLNGADIEVLNDNTVQVPINVAAVLCELEVNAIASSNDKGNKSCDATTDGIETFAAQ